jgi:signal peptidase I
MNASWKRILKGGVLIGGILFLVLGVRSFCINSYRISTPSMENTLHNGDYVLVNKLPLQSRLKRNGIFLFTSPLIQDQGNAPLLVSRCIALPGDTIRVNNDGYEVNGVLYPRSPNVLSSYILARELKTPILNILRELNIPVRNMTETSTSVTLSLTSFEEYRIREELTEKTNALFVRKETGSYSFVVPQQGIDYKLNESSLMACREAIRLETGDKAVFRNTKLYLNNREVPSFRFSRDYYWMLSDNINEAVDSRHLGFIPVSHIIGNAWFCWYSKDKQRIFKKLN